MAHNDVLDVLASQPSDKGFIPFTYLDRHRDVLVVHFDMEDYSECSCRGLTIYRRRSDAHPIGFRLEGIGVASLLRDIRFYLPEDVQSVPVGHVLWAFRGGASSESDIVAFRRLATRARELNMAIELPKDF